MNHTKLRSVSDGILEAAVLGAVACVPVFVNYYGFRVFEMGKASLLLAFAALAAVGALMALVESGQEGLTGLGRALRQPLVWAVLLLALATAVSSATSMLTRYSLVGSPERMQGLQSLLAGALLFAAAAHVGRAPERRRRILDVLAAASVPVVVYAFTQAAGIDVVPGIAENERVFGTLSNPIFLGAYLMLLLPVTLARALAALRDGRVAVFAAWVVLLAAQTGGLVLTASRGPLLGLLAGMLVFAFASAVARGARALGLATVGVGLLAAALLAAMAWPGGPLNAQTELPVIGRFAEISELDSGSQAVRLRIWATAATMLREEPESLLLGHGPETFRFAALPYGETYLGGRGQADRMVDRAHSVPFDALTMTGGLGLLALLLFWGAWLFTAAAAAGLAPARSDRIWLAGLLAGGTALGGLSWLWRPAYAGALLALGMAAGLGAYLLVALLRGRGAGDADLGAIALLAAGAALVVEAAFGIQTVVTQTVAFTLAGLVTAHALPAMAEPPVASPAAASRGRRRQEAGAGAESGGVRLRWSAAGTGLGLVFGTVASLLVYSLLIFGTQPLPDTIPTLLVMVVLTLVAAGLVALDRRLPLLPVLALAALAPALYYGLRAALLRSSQDAAVLFGVTLLWAMALVLLAGWGLRGRTAPGADFWAGPAGLLYPLFGVAAIVVVMLIGVRPVQADIYFQSAVANFSEALRIDDEQRFRQAEQLFTRATEMSPQDDIYYLTWAELFTTLAGQMGGPDSSVQAFTRAQTLLAAAETVNPVQPYHTYNRGHLQLMYADQLARAQRQDEAAQIASGSEQALQYVFDIIPYDPQISRELALARLLQGTDRLEEAIALLEYVRDELDPEDAQTRGLLAQAYRAAGRIEEAEAEEARAAELAPAMASPGTAPGGSAGTAPGGAPGGQGMASDVGSVLQAADQARQQGDLQTALSLYQQAVDALGPNADWRVYMNLGLLFDQLNRSDEAVQALSAAMQLAPDAESQATVQEALLGALSGEIAPPVEMNQP